MAMVMVGLMSRYTSCVEWVRQLDVLRRCHRHPWSSGYDVSLTR